MKRTILAALLGLAFLAAPVAEAGTALSHIGGVKTEIEDRLDGMPDTPSRQEIKEARRLTQALGTINRDFPRCPDVLKGGTKAAKILEKTYRSEIADRGTLFDLLEDMCDSFEAEIAEDYAAAESAVADEDNPKTKLKAQKALGKATTFLAKGASAPSFSKRAKMQWKAFRFVEKAARF
ncbi:MAG: hypothetical protein ACYTDX_09535, partial [Planctomycetota bacterium]